jgi:xanthine dehydrogenase YagS FAD-binding subunit
MREDVEHPDALIDVTGISSAGIAEFADGGLSIGVAVRNTAVANHPPVRERYPVLAQRRRPVPRHRAW